jgi:hypothetical protein
MIENGINRRIEGINEDEAKPKRQRRTSRSDEENPDRGSARLTSFKRGAFEKSQSSRRYPSSRSSKPSSKGRKK